MRMIIISLCLAGCTQAPAIVPTKSLPDGVVHFQPRKELDLKALEDRLANLEAAISRIEGAVKVGSQDREEIIAYNQCHKWCDQNYPWPKNEEGGDYKSFNETPWVKKAMKNHQKCWDECDKRKPTSQVDWSC